MPPTTRASARRASGAATPPRPTHWLVESVPPLRAPSPILGERMIDPIVATVASGPDIKKSLRLNPAPNQLGLNFFTQSSNLLFASDSSSAPSKGNYNDEWCGPFEGLDRLDGMNSIESVERSTSPSFSSGYSLQTLKASRSSKKRGKQTQKNPESDQQLMSFSKAAEPSPGVFSRVERQQVIASSTETAADRARISYIANAVLYKSFSVQSPHYHAQSSNTYIPYGGMRTFPMTPGPFPLPSEKSPPSTLTYRGTDRGKFQPLTLDSPDGRVTLQSICLSFPYLKISFEELRFGDYIRGRKKAPHLFDIFRKLPAEVRCMTWQFAMPARTVELRYDYSITKCWTLAKIPALLQVCRESRYEALKRYTLAFGIGGPPKIYFDFKRDTLFFTYEKWMGDSDYEGEIAELTSWLCRSEEATKIRHLAIDRDLLVIFAEILELEEEAWLDEGDESTSPPEIEAIPSYTSLQSLSIVKTTIDGFWNEEYLDCGCDEDDAEENCDVHQRMKKNDEAVIVSSYSYKVANRTQQEYYQQMVAQIKLQSPDWNVPTIEYMIKRPRRQKLVQGSSRKPRTTCTCGDCYSDSDW